ncbi:MAG: hypothetical protein AAGJ79_06400 [Verrucomicrobiota bacterium]
MAVFPDGVEEIEFRVAAVKVVWRVANDFGGGDFAFVRRCGGYLRFYFGFLVWMAEEVYFKEKVGDFFSASFSKQDSEIYLLPPWNFCVVHPHRHDHVIVAVLKQDLADCIPL